MAKKSKADQALAQRRVDDIYRIRLDGAQFIDVREFVREKEKDPSSAWFLQEGWSPLSDQQLYRYQQRADRAMLESCERSRKRLRARHLAQRRNLYARATTTGDLRTALSCLQDEADLLGLYPPKRTEHSGPKGQPLAVSFVEVAVPQGPPQGDQ